MNRFIRVVSFFHKGNSENCASVWNSMKLNPVSFFIIVILNSTVWKRIFSVFLCITSYLEATYLFALCPLLFPLRHFSSDNIIAPGPFIYTYYSADSYAALFKSCIGSL